MTITRLVINGPGSVAPGQSVQLSATAQFSDGTSRDVTSETQWESHNSGLLSISQTGLVTASEQRGEGDITARYSKAPAARNGANFASHELIVVPAGTYRLYGFIKDEDVYLNEVRVELTSGIAAGMAVTANGFFYFYGVSGDTEIRVSKQGYDTQVRRVVVTAHHTEEFRLVISRPRPVLEGTYTMRLAAADECRAALPESLRERAYTAVATQHGPSLTLKLQITPVKSLVPRAPGSTLNGTVEPNRIRLLADGHFDKTAEEANPPSILEELTTPETEAGVYSMFFAAYGLVSAAPTADGYAGTLDGGFEVLTLPGPWDYGARVYERRAVCHSSSHRFALTR